MLQLDPKKSERWSNGNKHIDTPIPKLPYEIAMEQNKIPYDEDPAVWHWSRRVRPVRCATDLTIYRNTTRTGVTV